MSAERAESLVPAVQGMVAFTAELDEIVTPDTAPSAVFVAEHD